MPIRTDRGRAAALRHFWSWPLRSGRHAIVTVLGLAAVITAVAMAANGLQALGDENNNEDSSATAGAATSPSAFSSVEEQPSRTSGNHRSLPPVGASRDSVEPPTTDGAAASTPASSSTQTPPGSVDDGKDGATQTAVAFMRRWVHDRDQDLSTEEWSRPLMPYVMPEVRVTLKSISPERVPATEMTGTPEVESTDKDIAKVAVPTDAGTITLTMVAHPNGQWLIKRWEPVEQ